jgi:regulator of protease activity HflC (stomatin/prohibitin superfamily)
MFSFKRFFIFILRITILFEENALILSTLRVIAKLLDGRVSLDELVSAVLKEVIYPDPVLIVMSALVLFISSDFMRAVYGLRDRSEGFGAVLRLRFGTRSFKPWVRASGGKLEADDKNPLVRVGGPGNLIVYNDSAAVLERAGKLTRVVKKGFAKLDDFEKVWDVVDLRPHHWVYDVGAMSKDGIPVTCQADVTFQIDEGGQRPTEDEPFPATEKAIFHAATRKSMFKREPEDERVFDWASKAIIGDAEGALRTILATYSLDQLIGPDEENRSHRRAEIRSKLETDLRGAFPGYGAKLIKVELGDIKVEDKIVQQRIEAWQAAWKRWTREREAEGDAAQLQAVEAAKAQAQADMIVAITQAFQPWAEAGTALRSQIVLLRMFEVLKRTAPFDPQTGMLFLPAEVMRTWEMIQKMTQGKPALPEAKESEE